MLLKNKMSVTACSDSLNAKTVNVKSVSAMCAKSVMIKKHDLRVSKSVVKPLRKPVASESIKKHRNNVRKLNERFGRIYKWTYINFTPSGYMWKPKSKQANVNPNLIEIVLFIVDSGCSKHMTGNLKLLINFVEKFLGTVKFGNDQIAPILGYGDLVQGAVTIKRVYYVEGLNHNLFSVGQFCDADLEVAFRKSTCFIRDLKGNDLLTCVDLISGSRDTNLYTISFDDMLKTSPICLLSKASKTKSWLWHHRLSHLNFGTLNKNDVVERKNRTLVEAASTIDDWDHLFQPMFDEDFNPTTIDVSPVPAAAAPRAVDLANSPVSMSIDQDAPSTRSSSNVRPIHTPFESLGRWTKDHPIANVIDDLSHSVYIRKQLETNAVWCYFDAFLTTVEPKNFKQAMTKLSWINAVQEEIHEFERLQVWELVPCQDKVILIKLKWIYKVKTDEFGRVLKNKVRLVAKGFRQDEGTDF
nr:integrase, catalytic region, zinc finger, CCHC-type, peptidase aspartic, catalytic [Tanacetum cinerariifolium]